MSGWLGREEDPPSGKAASDSPSGGFGDDSLK